MEYIDVNNINAAQLVHGDMMWDPVLQMPRCEYPKGSGKHVNFTTSLWTTAYDGQGTVRASAQTYRVDGNDYWPGPLTTAPLGYLESEKWAKIWKLDRTDLNSFLSQPNHTVANTPSVILTWPANGNQFAVGNNNAPLTIAAALAPFKDKNGNGVYEPLDGDYPEMKGDQMLWYVFNDNGPAHDQTNSLPLGVEVQCMAYAYSQNNVYDNMIFYDYLITNRSAFTLDSFCTAIRTDASVGYAFDDYIGFDSAARLGIMYNGDPLDGAGEPWSYADSIPIVGFKLLWVPGDSCGDATPAGSFMYHNNNNDALMGGPVNPAQINNYLKSRWRNGEPLRNDYAGPGINSNGTGPGPKAKYVFNGDPTNPAQWSECGSMNSQGFRRFIMSTEPVTLNAGSTVRFAVALLVTPRSNTGVCFGAGFTEIRKMSDSAQKIFCNPPVYTLVNDAYARTKQLKLFPNPAGSIVFVQTPVGRNEHIQTIDCTGRRINVFFQRDNGIIKMHIGDLAPGIYHILYRSDNYSCSHSFVRE
jgi:hypothetical protein